MKLPGRLNYFLFVTLRIWKFKSLSTCKNVKGYPDVYHPLLLSGKGNISFGQRVQAGVVTSSNFYSHYIYLEARFSDSFIVIGSDTSINNGFSAVAMKSITIGNHVLIGINCSIMDSDGHDTNPQNRTNDSTANPVEIGNNVFIGSNVTILKGVKIGCNAVIGNGSVVTKDVSKNTIVAGNPAKIIKNI
ncbi:acyltransferase [Flavobacterium psychrotrophum]|uniref:acyltransferase n=1 Tax=Flavobacterium psychrotrophum TaxID=2294119 RepID=UPI000E30ECEB|nr:acyltransferase [Flavobacterium psychrotrophum]